MMDLDPYGIHEQLYASLAILLRGAQCSMSVYFSKLCSQGSYVSQSRAHIVVL
jgi:hypothetical protein